MEIVVPIQEFHFDSSTTTPFMSAPSTPKRFDFCHRYAAAPTTLAAAAAARFLPPLNNSHHAAPDDDDFEFSGPLNNGAPLPEITTADELFEKGKIRTLKFPLQLCPPTVSRQTVGEPSDSFMASANDAGREGRVRNRGSSISSSRSRKGSRSLSPLRDAGESGRFQDPNLNGSISCSCKDVDGDGGGSRKWCFKNLLLFRSASEGRATGSRGKDRLRKYTAACSSPGVKRAAGGDESRGSSFRYAEIGSSVRRDGGRGLTSPHAVHYEASRAAAEELRKKTALPYKEGFFSFLRFAPASRVK